MRHNYYPLYTTLLIMVMVYAVCVGLKYQTILPIKSVDWLADVRTPKPNVKNLAIFKAQQKHVAILQQNSTNLTNKVDALQNYHIACQQLKQHKRKTVRIAYFGDSMIEGDIITEYLRAYLQQIYGGSGVGFVPLTSVCAGYTANYKLSFSDNYSVFNFNMRDTINNYKPYLSGYVFNAPMDNVATTKLSLYNTYATTNFYLMGYNYGKTTNLEILLNNTTISYKIQGNTLYKQLLKKLSNTVNIGLTYNDKIAYYGLQTEADTGIVLDNFAFRGSTGLNLSAINYNLFTQINNTNPYDLVILHYGLNIGTDDQQNFSNYEATMQRVIRYLKRATPNASYMLVSVGDKCIKSNKEWISAPYIPYLIKTQQALADSANAYFYNLNTTMGGIGGMLTWATADTALAQKDYTHINAKGGKRVAQELFKVLK
jgi:lysophospholipase L1-like esterase